MLHLPFFATLWSESVGRLPALDGRDHLIASALGRLVARCHDSQTYGSQPTGSIIHGTRAVKRQSTSPPKSLHNSLANLAPPWTSETSPRHDRTGERSSPGMSYLQWLSELDKVMPDGTAFHSAEDLEKIADDGRAPRSKRAAARDLLGMARGDYFKAQPMMADHINRVMDRSVGRPPQAIHMTSEAETTVRVVLLDRTESPTYKMVQEIMAREALGADEPKQLQAGEQEG